MAKKNKEPRIGKRPCPRERKGKVAPVVDVKMAAANDNTPTPELKNITPRLSADQIVERLRPQQARGQARQATGDCDIRTVWIRGVQLGQPRREARDYPGGSPREVCCAPQGGQGNLAKSDYQSLMQLREPCGAG